MTSHPQAGTPRIGVILPTFNRPDLARMAVLQMLAQSRVPDLICVHQNGHSDSYAWAVADLDQDRIVWLHSTESLPQHQWYIRPMRLLIERGCTHYFWVDHDDIYLRHHVEQSLIDLADADFTISDACGLLIQNGRDFAYQAEVKFTSHAPGGMSSSMCFNRDFALALNEDLARDRDHAYSDQVVAWVTAPKFRCLTTQRRSTVYVSHPGSVSSAHWVKDSLPEKATPAGRPAGELLQMFDQGTGERCHKWRHYFEIYERHLLNFRDRPSTSLTIGVELGGSLDLMKRYLGAQARMVGIDLDPACKVNTGAGHEIFIGDPCDPVFLQQVIAACDQFDIVIDDGSHTPDQQIASFYALFPALADGGVYIVEDLHTNLWASHQRSRYGITFLDLAKAMADKMTYRHLDPASFMTFGGAANASSAAARGDNFVTDQVFGIHFHDSMVVFEKRAYVQPCRERR